MKRINLNFLTIILVAISIKSLATEKSTENNPTNNQVNNLGASNYQIQKFTVSSGGGVISGGEYSLTSSIGQIDAGPKLVGGVFLVTGGFLQDNSDLIFKNSFEQ